MSARPAPAQSRRIQSRSILDWFQRNNVVALALLLLLFVVAVELLKPGTVNFGWLSNTLLFAAPLGVLAAGQTMVMLTGGIDLSVVSVAMGSAFLMTTTALEFGNLTAVAIGLGLGLLVGAINGVGVALLGVEPLVMTLGTGLMTQGIIIVYSQRILASRSIVPDFIHAIGSDRLEIIPFDVFLWLPIAALVMVTLKQTGFGRLLYAIGDNTEGCRLAGVRVWRLCSSTTSSVRSSRPSRDSSLSAIPIPPTSVWPRPTSCRPSRLSSLAAPRFSAAAAAIRAPSLAR